MSGFPPISELLPSATINHSSVHQHKTPNIHITINRDSRKMRIPFQKVSFGNDSGAS